MMPQARCLAVGCSETDDSEGGQQRLSNSTKWTIGHQLSVQVGACTLCMCMTSNQERHVKQGSGIFLRAWCLLAGGCDLQRRGPLTIHACTKGQTFKEAVTQTATCVQSNSGFHARANLQRASDLWPWVGPGARIPRSLLRGSAAFVISIPTPGKAHLHTAQA